MTDLRKFKPLASCAGWFALGLLLLVVLCVVLIGVLWAYEEFFGPEATITYSGGIEGTFENARPGVRCYESDNGLRPGIGFSASSSMSDSWLNLHLLASPLPGTFAFEHLSADDPGNWPEAGWGINGFLYAPEGSLVVNHHNLIEGTLTLDAVRSGFQQRIAGHFEATFANSDGGEPVTVKGDFSIPAANANECLR